MSHAQGALLRGAVLTDRSRIRDAHIAWVGMWNHGRVSDIPVTRFQRDALKFLLEALVVDTHVLIDEIPQLRYRGYGNGWKELLNLKDLDTGLPIFQEVNLASSSVYSEIVESAIRRLTFHLTHEPGEAVLMRFAADIQSPEIDEFYKIQRSLLDDISSRGYRLSSTAENWLDDMLWFLRRTPSYVQNYARYAYRGLYYQKLAWQRRLVYFPHHWRSGLMALDKVEWWIQRSFAHTIINRPGEFVHQSLNEYTRMAGGFGASDQGGTYGLAAYIAHNSPSREELFATALQIRDRPEARAFRKWTTQIQQYIFNQSNSVELWNAWCAVEDIERELCERLRVPYEAFSGRVQQPRRKLSLGLIIPPASVSSDAEVPTLSWLIARRRRYLSFIRSIARATLDIESFERNYNRLCA